MNKRNFIALGLSILPYFISKYVIEYFTEIEMEWWVLLMLTLGWGLWIRKELQEWEDKGEIKNENTI